MTRCAKNLGIHVAPVPLQVQFHEKTGPVRQILGNKWRTGQIFPNAAERDTGHQPGRKNRPAEIPAICRRTMAETQSRHTDLWSAWRYLKLIGAQKSSWMAFRNCRINALLN